MLSLKELPHDLKHISQFRYSAGLPNIKTRHYLLYNREGEWKIEKEFDTADEAIRASFKSRIGMAVSRRNLPDGGILQRVLAYASFDHVLKKSTKETIEPNLPLEHEQSYREDTNPFVPPVIRHDHAASLINSLLSGKGEVWERLAAALDKPVQRIVSHKGEKPKELSLVRLAGSPYFVSFDKEFAQKLSVALRKSKNLPATVESYGIPASTVEAFSDKRIAAKPKEMEYESKMKAALEGRHFEGRIPGFPDESAFCKCWECQSK